MPIIYNAIKTYPAFPYGDMGANIVRFRVTDWVSINNFKGYSYYWNGDSWNLYLYRHDGASKVELARGTVDAGPQALTIQAIGNSIQCGPLSAIDSTYAFGAWTGYDLDDGAAFTLEILTFGDTVSCSSANGNAEGASLIAAGGRGYSIEGIVNSSINIDASVSTFEGQEISVNISTLVNAEVGLCDSRGLPIEAFGIWNALINVAQSAASGEGFPIDIFGIWNQNLGIETGTGNADGNICQIAGQWNQALDLQIGEATAAGYLADAFGICNQTIDTFYGDVLVSGLLLEVTGYITLYAPVATDVSAWINPLGIFAQSYVENINIDIENEIESLIFVNSSLASSAIAPIGKIQELDTINIITSISKVSMIHDTDEPL